MSDTIAGLIGGVALALLPTLYLGERLTTWEWQVETVQRGLAQYCPMTGEWAWIGECDG